MKARRYAMPGSAYFTILIYFKIVFENINLRCFISAFPTEIMNKLLVNLPMPIPLSSEGMTFPLGCSQSGLDRGDSCSPTPFWGAISHTADISYGTVLKINHKNTQSN